MERKNRPTGLISIKILINYKEEKSLRVENEKKIFEPFTTT